MVGSNTDMNFKYVAELPSNFYSFSMGLGDRDDSAHMFAVLLVNARG